MAQEHSVGTAVHDERPRTRVHEVAEICAQRNRLDREIRGAARRCQQTDGRRQSKEEKGAIKKKHLPKKTNEGLADLADMAERDHEVQMARSDLYKIAKYAIKLHEMMKNISEAEGLEGWVQSKITKAADYMDSVYHSLDYEINMDKAMMPESIKPKRFKPTLTNEEYTTYKGSLNSKLKKKM